MPNRHYITPAEARQAALWRAAGVTWKEIAARIGCSKTGIRTRVQHNNPRVALSDCGTIGGYRRHRDNGDPKCLPCWAAWARRAAEYRADTQPRLVDAAPTTTLIREALQHLTPREIGQLADLHHSQVSVLARGRKARVHRDTAARIRAALQPERAA